MSKKVIAFDLDGTLAPSKSPLPDRMAEALRQLLERKDVCVISGGRFEQFELQLLNNLQAPPKLLERLHIMPTCGTRYYRFEKGKWKLLYHNDIPKADKKRIIKLIEEKAKEIDLWVDKPHGEIIEDRGSQITYSALGQDIVTELGTEGVRIKEKWDPDHKRRQKLKALIDPELPDFEVRIGGLTSVDITLPGIDKAYGMKKLCEELKIKPSEILFIGDALFEGGNDYPVKAMGIDTLEVARWEDTALAVQAIAHVL